MRLNILPERFSSKIEVGDGGCWLWTASLDKDGYGRYGFQGKGLRAHRYSYEVLVGMIGDGLTIDHLCRVRRCVNPDHLRPCSLIENQRAPGSTSLASRRPPKTHCPKGHPYDEVNTYTYSDGRRCCIQCRKATGRRHYLASRGDAILE